MALDVFVESHRPARYCCTRCGAIWEANSYGPPREATQHERTCDAAEDDVYHFAYDGTVRERGHN